MFKYTKHPWDQNDLYLRCLINVCWTERIRADFPCRLSCKEKKVLATYQVSRPFDSYPSHYKWANWCSSLYTVLLCIELAQTSSLEYDELWAPWQNWASGLAKLRNEPRKMWLNWGSITLNPACAAQLASPYDTSNLVV